MLGVTAREVRHPVPFVVLVVPDDFALHNSATIKNPLDCGAAETAPRV
jgi:hypothetical protein